MRGDCGEHVREGVEGDGEGTEHLRLAGDGEERADGVERASAGEPVTGDLGRRSVGGGEASGGFPVGGESFVWGHLVGEGASDDVVTEPVLVTDDDEHAGVESPIEEGEGTRLVAGGQSDNAGHVDVSVEEREPAERDDLSLGQIDEAIRDDLADVGWYVVASGGGPAGQLDDGEGVALGERDHLGERAVLEGPVGDGPGQSGGGVGIERADLDDGEPVCPHEPAELAVELWPSRFAAQGQDEDYGIAR